MFCMLYALSGLIFYRLRLICVVYAVMKSKDWEPRTRFRWLVGVFVVVTCLYVGMGVVACTYDCCGRHPQAKETILVSLIMGYLSTLRWFHDLWR